MFNSNLFADRIKKARMRKEMSQSDLAEKVGLSTTTISSYEKSTGQKIPALDKALTIAEALDVSLDWLCGLSDTDTGKTSTVEVLKGLANAISILSLNVEYHYATGFSPPSMQISASNSLLMDFLMDLNKIAPVLNDKDVPDYLKAGLKNTIYEKYQKYDISQLIFDPQQQHESNSSSEGDYPF